MMTPVETATARFCESYRARETARNEYLLALARGGWSANVASTVAARRKVMSADIDFSLRADELGEAFAIYGDDPYNPAREI